MDLDQSSQCLIAAWAIDFPEQIISFFKIRRHAGANEAARSREERRSGNAVKRNDNHQRLGTSGLAQE